MDYRRLLKKYMELVREAEGITYLYHGAAHGPDEITDEEYAELHRIDKEPWRSGESLTSAS